jgi:hypothetical protein
VADQLAAFRRWGMGGEFPVYANRGLNGFDYGPYEGAMRSAARPGVVDSTPPRLGVDGAAAKRVRERRARTRGSGAAVVVRGDTSDNLAVRAVRWRTNTGRTGVATLAWRPASADPGDGFAGTTRWSFRFAPRPGETRLTVSAEDIKGLSARRAIALRSSGAPARRRR